MHSPLRDGADEECREEEEENRKGAKHYLKNKRIICREREREKSRVVWPKRDEKAALGLSKDSEETEEKAEA